MNSNEMEKLQPLLDRISRVLLKKVIPPKFQQKIELLQKSLIDPTLEPNSLDYDQLRYDELTSLSKLNKESKIELLISLCNLFFKQTRVIGELDVLGRSSILWQRKQIEIDLDLKELTIHRQNPNDKPYIFDLTEFLINYRGFLRNRYQYELICQDPNAQIKEIIIGSQDKEEINRWLGYLEQCCKVEQSERSKTIHAKSEIKEKNELESRDRYKTTIVKKKQLDDTQISRLKQSQSCDEHQLDIQVPIIQQELPQLLTSLKDRLNMEFLMNDQDFQLVSFEQCARIMQSRQNKNNFRVYLSLPKTSLEILITSIYDTYSIMKWNKQVKHQTIVLQVTPLLAQIEEIREPLNFIYQPRQFKYLRYIYPQKNAFFIIDKSNDDENELNGKIEWTITGIFMQDLQCKLMVVDTLVHNKGYITQLQDQQLILTYLRQYQNFKQYLKEENRKEQVGQVTPPIFVSDALILINKYQEQRFRSQNTKFTFSSNSNFDIHQSEQSSVDGDPQQQDSFLFEDIRPDYSKNAVVHSLDYQIIQNLGETPQQFLMRRLKEIENNIHCLSQLHYYQLVPQKNIQLDKLEINLDGSHFFYAKDWVYDTKKGYLKFINQEKLEAQKKVLMYILQQIGSSLFRATSVLNISLPVYVFERRSNLQRFASSFSYAPHFLEPVTNSNPLDQIKATLSFIVSINIMYLSLEKPFNPILGETFQCWIKGCPIYLEQISHHPPIAAFIMYGHGYKFYGHFQTIANLGLNTITGSNFGRVTVEFENGSKLEFNNCKGYLCGITMGERIFYLEGPIYCIDYVNEYLGELYMNPPSGLFAKKMPLDYYQGAIYKIDEKEVLKWKKLGYKKYTGLRGSSHKYPLLSQIDGFWQCEGKNLNVDGRNTFNIMNDFPYQVYPEQFPIASDSQYRIDLLAWQLNDFDLTMKNKEQLEVLQRRDRKLRQK